MGERVINFDLDDPRSVKIAEVLANNSCKKILGMLAEGEMNASEISKKLDLPLNTIGYNLEKLVEAGLIEKSKGFLWSVKGKKIERYKLINKKIIISPKKLGLRMIPVLAISALVGIVIKMYGDKRYNEYQTATSKEEMLRSSATMARESLDKGIRDGIGEGLYNGLNDNILSVLAGDAGIWFIFGAFFALLLFLAINWRRV